MKVIFDNHLHLNRNGKFLDAIREFKKTGGTHFVLCQLPMVDKVIREKSYKSIMVKKAKILILWREGKSELLKGN